MYKSRPLIAFGLTMPFLSISKSGLFPHLIKKGKKTESRWRSEGTILRYEVIERRSESGDKDGFDLPVICVETKGISP